MFNGLVLRDLKPCSILGITIHLFLSKKRKKFACLSERLDGIVAGIIFPSRTCVHFDEVHEALGRHARRIPYWNP